MARVIFFLVIACLAALCGLYLAGLSLLMAGNVVRNPNLFMAVVTFLIFTGGVAHLLAAYLALFGHGTSSAWLLAMICGVWTWFLAHWIFSLLVVTSNSFIELDSKIWLFFGPFIAAYGIYRVCFWLFFSARFTPPGQNHS